MKKLFLASALCLMASGISAQSLWHTDPSKSNLLISAEDEAGASSPQVKETKDGKFWVTWLSWADGMNSYIKAQLLDKQGHALLDEGGIYVSKQVTSTWTSGYGMNITPEGNLVVCHSDSRNDPDRNEFTPYAYMIDQEGNQLWGLTGTEVPTQAHRGHRPVVGISDEGTIFIGINDLSDDGQSSGFTVYKYNEDGTLAWGSPLTVNGMFGAFAPCEEDDQYLSIIGGGAIQLYRFDSLGDLVWDEPVIVEDREPYSRSECVPVFDELGGVVMPYQRYISLSVCYAGMQRINPDGETCMGMRGIDLSDVPAQHSAPGISLNGKRQEMIAAWAVSEASYNNLYVMKYDYSGVPLWDEPIKVLEDRYMWGYPTTHAAMLDDGTSIICYDSQNGAVNSNLHIMKIDGNGEVLWDKEMSPEAYRSKPVLFFDKENGKGYVFWTDNRKDSGSSPSGGIYAQEFDLVDGSETAVESIGAEGISIENAGGVITVTCEGEGTAELYDLAGAKAASHSLSAGVNTFAPQVTPGLYIVRVATVNGSLTKKVNIL